MSQKFDVLLNVRADKLSMLLAAIEGACDLLQVQLSRGNARIGYLKEEASSIPIPIVGAINQPRAINKKTGLPQSARFANGVRNKGITGADLAMEVLARQNRPWTYNEIAQEFVNRGFARTTTSSVLWTLAHKKKIRFLGDGKYCLPGTTIHMGAGNGS